MAAKQRIDSRTVRATEDAEGVEVFDERTSFAADVVEHEEAQGVEVFDSPDAVIPVDALRNGAPGSEALSAESAGFEDRDEDAGYERGAAAEEYPEA